MIRHIIIVSATVLYPYFCAVLKLLHICDKPNEKKKCSDSDLCCAIYIAVQWDQRQHIKTHGSVSCGPRKRGACKRSEYIDRNNKVAIFTHL